jgi:hypothetical protein
MPADLDAVVQQEDLAQEFAHLPKILFGLVWAASRFQVHIVSQGWQPGRKEMAVL